MVMRLRSLIGASAAQQSADVGSSHVIGHLTQHHHCGACRDGPSNSHSLTRTCHEMPDTFCDACLQHPAINVFGCSRSSLSSVLPRTVWLALALLLVRVTSPFTHAI